MSFRIIKILQYLVFFPGLVFTGVCFGQSVPVTSALSESVQSALYAMGAADGSVVVDGILDEGIWQAAEPINAFRQVEPEYGALATLDTEVRVVYDAQYLYVGAVMHDTVGVEGIRVPDLRRDFEWSDNDLFGLSLDGFDDGRTAVSFQVTPYGTLRDLLVIDGSQFNRDWDAVWSARTQVTDAGWVAEIAIPWSTLRYAEAEVPVWRANFFRRLRRADEIHAWYPYSRSLTPYYMDNAGQLLGLKPPPPARNLRIQPYLTFQQDEIDGNSDTKPDFGGDLKWAITPNSVLDLTVNTDFAQADADRQVVNLTRFSVFFPEKRAFFLESAELFEVGGSAVALPYFSRRIGLDPTGQPIPLDAGGRFVYRSSTQSLGGLVMRQRRAGETPAALFGVGRYSRNIGERGRVGGLVTVRQDERLGELAAVQNTTASIDGYMRPFGALQVNGMWSQSWTDDGTGSGAAAYTWIRHQSNLGYFGHIQGLVTDAYKPGSRLCG